MGIEDSLKVVPIDLPVTPAIAKWRRRVGRGPQAGRTLSVQVHWWWSTEEGSILDDAGLQSLLADAPNMIGDQQRDWCQPKREDRIHSPTP